MIDIIIVEVCCRHQLLKLIDCIWRLHGWSMFGGRGRGGACRDTCKYVRLWLAERWLYCSLCPIIQSSYWFHLKLSGIRFHHNSSRISIISDQFWLWIPDFRWRWTLSTQPGTVLLNRRSPKKMVSYFLYLLSSFIFPALSNKCLKLSSPTTCLNLIYCFIIDVDYFCSLLLLCRLCCLSLLI